MRPRLSRREFFFLLFAGLAGLVMLAGFISMNLAVLRGIGAGGDFILQWEGARSLYGGEVEPYSGQAANLVQVQVYGRDAQTGEKPFILNIPAFLLILYFPLSLFKDLAAARALFLLVSEAAFILLLLFSLDLAEWQPRRFFLAAFFFLSAAGLYNLWSLMQGSPALVLAVLYAGTLLALRAQNDELAGMLMALSFQHWETGAPFMIFILLWALSHGRGRVVIGLFMGLFVLLVVSFFVYPGWFVPWLRANLANFQWNYGFSPASTLAAAWPEYGAQAGRVASIGLWVLLITEWFSARRSEFRRAYWTACLSLAAAPLLGWHSELQDFVILILPVGFILAVIRMRWKAGYWLSGLILGSALLVPWGLLLGNWLTPDLQKTLLFLLPPVFAIIGLYWIRWWALRPARTWLERASLPEYR